MASSAAGKRINGRLAELRVTILGNGAEAAAVACGMVASGIGEVRLGDLEQGTVTQGIWPAVAVGGLELLDLEADLLVVAMSPARDSATLVGPLKPSVTRAAKASPHGIFIVATKPVEPLCELVWRLSAWPRERVLGVRGGGGTRPGTASGSLALVAAVRRAVIAIGEDRHEVVPCAARLEGELGVEGVFSFAPVRLGRVGVEGIVEAGLNDEQRALLKVAAAMAVAETKAVLRAAGLLEKSG